jgi:O-antigen/teichoic acid export membrane protein/SAM-dependent methyltransferase
VSHLEKMISYIRRHLSQALYSNAYFILLAALVPGVFGYIFWGVVARLLPVDQVGIASALISVTAFLTLVSGMDLGTTLIRYLPTDPDPAALINTSLWLRTIMATLASFVFLAGLSLWSPAQSFLMSSVPLIMIFVLANVIQSLNELMVHIFVAYRKSRLALFKNIYVTIARFPIVIVSALLIASFDAVGLFVAITVSVALVLVYIIWSMIPAVVPNYRLRFQFSLSQIRPLLRFSTGNFIAELLLQMPLLLIPVIVVNRLGNGESGVAYVVMMLSSIVAMLPMGLARSLLSEGAHNPRLLRINLLRVLVLSFGLGIILIVGLVLTGGLLLRVTFGPVYAEQGMPFLRLSTIAVIPMTVVFAAFTLERIKGRIFRLMLIGVVVCVLSLGLMILLIRTQGLTGVGIGFLIGQLAGAVCSLPSVGSVLRVASRGVQQPTEYSSNHKTFALILDEQLVSLGSNIKILDVGCGSGSLVRIIRQATEDTAEIIGVDVDFNALSVAQAEHKEPNCWYIQYDGYNLPLAPDSIDLAIGQEVIEHVSDDAKFMAALAASLKPGGICILTTPNATRQPLTATSHPDHVRHYTPSTLQELAVTSGFEVVDAFYRYHLLSGFMDRLLLLVGRRVLPTYEVQPHMTVVKNPNEHSLLRFYDHWIDPFITVVEQTEFKLMRKLPAEGQVCILRKPVAADTSKVIELESTEEAIAL